VTTDNATDVDGRTARWAGRRLELLASAREFVLDQGVSNLTLRPVADAMGVTIATVIRQFGSKDALLRAIVEDINTELALELRAGPEPDSRPAEDLLRALWHRWSHDPRRRREFAVCFELYGLAIATPQRYGWFLDSVVTQWLDIIEVQLDQVSIAQAEKRKVATLILALFRGLHLDLIATGDVKRVDATFELVATTLLKILGP
jgi:AcrR family transcriptional regulator